MAAIGGALGLLIVLPLFSATKLLRGVFVNEVLEIADEESQSFDLLVPGRKIPKSSTRITAHVMHFQDATNYKVKFDAPIADARTFMVDTVGVNGRDCERWPTTRELKGWPAERPVDALCREDRDRANDDDRPITIAIIPHGATATVLVYTTM